jgi:hypothetical protein
VGQVFVVKFLHKGIKSNQEGSKDGQDHNIRDAPASLYINKNLGLQIFKLLFFEHYASFVKLGAPSG